ncbi:hypothetical protein ACFE04_008315 [Oxalis oulophora]
MFKFEIPGYYYQLRVRKSKLGGGAIIYVKNSIKCVLTEIEYAERNIEGFLRDLEKECLNLPENAIILGDININTLRDSPNLSEYSGMVSSHGFLQRVTEATWTARDLVSCLDHCWIRLPGIKNKISLENNVGLVVEEVPFSDHSILYLKIRFAICLENPISTEYKFTNWLKVAEDLQRVDWDFTADASINVDATCTKFIENINEITEKHTSSRKIQLVDIKKKIRNQTREDKHAYFGAELFANKGIPKKYWSTIKGLMNVSKDAIKEIEVEGTRVKSHSKIPNNEFSISSTRSSGSMFCEKVTRNESSVKSNQLSTWGAHGLQAQLAKHTEAMVSKLQLANFQICHLAKSIPRMHVYEPTRRSMSLYFALSISHWAGHSKSSPTQC